MNHLVYLSARAGELEKILSGVKTMLVKECDPTQAAMQPVSPGDGLYFLKDQDDCAVRVKATVVRVLDCTAGLAEDLSVILKEMQPRLQLTEDQYNYWAVRRQVVLVEFGAAHKIAAIQVLPEKVTARTSWTALEKLNGIR